MKNLLNRGLSALLALALCLSLWVVVPAPEADAAGTVEYRYGSTSEYSNCSNVIYNWGNRGTTATFLSPNAEKFYEDNNTSYAALSALKGSSTVSSVPSSALFTKLRTLMTDNHDYETSYNATRDMFAFTDCQNSALTSTKISSFYSGSQIGPGWDGGSTWNREHTWPDSKGDANGNGENDIMMLRPASSSENSGRNNTAYGESSGYYNPNKASGGTYDLRGDVARIVLYVYVRWQDTGSSAAVLFDTNGVIESKEVLLKWMAEDPVDTWELGRNDSVESITGTRNVFVDYPELGFLLFGASVPADYQSPSSGTGDSGDTETVTVAFMENGKQTKSYAVPAGQSVEMPAATVTPDSGYSFAGWVTSVVEETASKPATVYLPGTTVTAAEQTYYALYTRVDTSTGSGNIYKLYSGNITEGDYIITYTDSTGTGAMEATLSSNRFAYQLVTVNNDQIVAPSSDIVWSIAANGDYYTLYNSGYATASYTNNQMVHLNYLGKDGYGLWSISGTETYNFVNSGNSKYLRKNSTYGFSAYAQSTGGPLTLYKATTGTAYYTTTTTNCRHTETYLFGKVDATCTTAGYTGDTLCASCGITIRKGTAVAALGHSYSNGVCTNCGETQPGINGGYLLVTPETATAGNYIIGAVRDGAYPSVYPATAAISGDWTVSSSAVTVQENIISVEQLPKDAQVVTLTGDNENGFAVGFEVNGTMQYLGYTSTTTSRKLALGAQYNTTLWKIVADPDGGVALASNYGTKNYTISQNSTGTGAIRGYYTGTIYTGIYLFREVEAQVEKPKVAQVGDTQYESFADAYAASANGQTVKLLNTIGEGDPITLNMTHDLYIDLDGWCLYADVTANGYTVYGKDSNTDTYGSEDYGALVLTGATVATQDGYLAYHEADAISFHAYELKLLAVSLDAANDALGYKAQFFGDEVACSMVTGFGFNMGVQVQKSYTKTGKLTAGQIFTLRLKNVLACNGGELDITASAFVSFGDTSVTTDTHSTTMRETIEAVNGNWNSYTDDQKAAVLDLYDKHAAVIDSWLGENNNLK